MSPAASTSNLRNSGSPQEAERKLAQSHERLRALAALSYDWGWEQDEELRFTYHSAEWSPYRDTIRSTVLGRTRFELPIQWQSDLCALMSRMMLDTPTIAPPASRSGARLIETSMRLPLRATRTVSRLSTASPASTRGPVEAFSCSAISGG